MRKAPLLSDNRGLRYFIASIEGETQNAVSDFIELRYRGAEFLSIVENATLRETMRDALDADYEVHQYKNTGGLFSHIIPTFKRKMLSIIKERDDKYEQYELVRRLVDSDNRALLITKTKWR